MKAPRFRIGWLMVAAAIIAPASDASQTASRVEVWRGGLGEAKLVLPLSVGSASRASPYSVSTPRSSNRTGGFPASGSRTRPHAVFRVRRHRQLLNIMWS